MFISFWRISHIYFLLFETIPFFYQNSILNCANQGSKTTLFSLFHLFICYWCLLDQYLKAIRVNYALVKRVKSRGCQRRLYFVTFVLIWIGIGNHHIHISFYIWYDNILEWVVEAVIYLLLIYFGDSLLSYPRLICCQLSYFYQLSTVRMCYCVCCTALCTVCCMCVHVLMTSMRYGGATQVSSERRQREATR